MSANQAAQQLDALGDATRRAIFERLAAGPLAVGELAQKLPVTRPAVSQHLKVLKEVGLVTDRAEGTRRLYTIDRAGLAVLRAYFDRFWESALDAFRTAAEESYAAEPSSRGATARKRPSRFPAASPRKPATSRRSQRIEPSERSQRSQRSEENER